MTIWADYFDGLSAQAHAVKVCVQGEQLHIDGDGVSRAVPLRQVQWPERQRHGARVAHLLDGASLHARDNAAWDAWQRGVRPNESLPVRLQQSWRGTLAAVFALLVIVAAGYRWGLPVAARGALAFVPAQTDRSVGDAALASMEGRWLRPSALPEAQRLRIAQAFAEAVSHAYAPSERPPYTLLFRKSRLGPNAFALPGGTIVLTDEMVTLLANHEDVLIGVLGHELGHVRQRHSMRLVVQTSLLGALTGLAFGDFSSVLAGVPAVLGSMDYSRDFEREADDEAAAMLRANGQSPALMVELFDALDRDEQRRRNATNNASDNATKNDGDDGVMQRLGIALSSHPADEERRQRFRDAARR